MITDNVATVLTSLFIGFYGKTAHKPKWMALACIITGLSITLTSLPYFLFGSATPDDLEIVKNMTSLMNKKADKMTTTYHMCLDEPIEEHCDTESMSNASIVTTIALLCFGASNFFRGFGTSIFFTYAATYIDDNVSKSMMPLLFGLMFAARLFGAPIGLVFSSMSLQYYENPWAKPIGIDKNDPSWIGAWWIGFLVSGTLIALLSIPLYQFPAQMKKPKEEADEDVEHGTPSGDQIVPNPTTGNKSDFDGEQNDMNGPIRTIDGEPVRNSKDNHMNKTTNDLRNLPIEIWQIIKNPIIICQMLGNMFRGIGLIGFFVFQTKYIENEFRQPASKASLISGTTGFLGKIFGVIFGGIFITCLRPGPRFLTSYIFLVELTSVFALILGSLVLGPQMYLPGTQIDQSTGQLNLMSKCNNNCNCANVPYQPVCDPQAGTSMSFFSPCHAGCMSSMTELDDPNEMHYSDCRCIPTHLKNQIAQLRKCTPDSFNVYTYAYIIAVGSMISGSSRTGNSVTLLRSIEPQQKALTLSIQGFWHSLAVSIPYPLLYSKIFDWNCIVWRKDCNKKGNCWLYDKEKLRMNYHGISICLVALGSIFDLIMIFLSPRLQQLYDDDDLKKKSPFQRIISSISSGGEKKKQASNNRDRKGSKEAAEQHVLSDIPQTKRETTTNQ